MSGQKPIDYRPSGSRCILICAGDLAIDHIDIRPEDYTIAVDGGYLYSRLLGITPDLVVGDFDSVDEETKEEISRMESAGKEVLRLNSEKDDTDTLAALRVALERGFQEFRIYGALGGRTEHTIANIQCLTYLKNMKAVGYILDGGTMMTVIRDESILFQPETAGYLSLFSLGEKAEGVTIKGMKYPLSDYTVTYDYPIGVSNEFIGLAGEVTVRKGTLLLILNWGEE